MLHTFRHAVAFVGLILISVGVNGREASAQFVGVQYGPRAFSSAPVGTQAVSLTYDRTTIGIDVNGVLLSGFDTTSQAFYLSYSNYFSLFGKTASVMLSLPYVDIELSVSTTCCGTFPGLATSGITDPMVQFNYPVVGGDALAPKEFFQTEPGFAASLHAGVRIPIGRYDSNSPLNVGANRWEFRIGLPMSYTWGTPTKQTAIEFAPVVYIFGDNSDPFGAANSSQDPVLQLEAHLVHDFSPMFFGSLNLLHVVGGETSTEGVGAGNSLSYTSGGATIGGRLSRNIGWSLTYGRQLSTKSSGKDGSLIRAGLTFTF